MSDQAADPAEDHAHKQEMQELKRVQDEKVRATTEKRGIVIVNTGDGKGKSTSAFGTAIRAAGHGLRVGLVQFIKGTWKTGEKEALKRFPEIEHVVSGDGFTWNTQDRAQDIASARRGWEQAIAMIEAARVDPGRYHLVILDELNIALRYDYLPADEVAAVLRGKPRELSILVTGRDAPQAVIDAADTVTRMENVKHAFDAGIKARRGVDF
jgi:cob(I)alamin adenosyltransferase